MALTGGTAFVPQKAPVAASRAAAVQRYLNKASGKMETAAAMHAYKAPGKMPAGHTQQQHMSTANQPEANPYHKAATQQIRQATQTELEPYKSKAAELTQYEGTAAKRLQGYAGSTDKLLGGLQEGAQASAKTASNQAAEAALKAQGSVNQDQSLTAQGNGNYLDPQVKAALENQRANITAIGASRGAAAETLGQNQANFLTNIRAVAGQRALEGQSGVASRYGQQQTANSQAESNLIQKQPERITNRESALAKEAFTRKATEAGLGIKEGALRNTERATGSKIKTEAGKLANEGTKVAQSAKRLEIDEKHYQESDKAARERAQAALKHATGGLTTPEQDKVASEIGSAFNTIQSLRTKGVPEGKITTYLNNGYRRVVEEYTNSKGKKGEKAVTEKLASVKNPALQKAAMELWKYHKVSPQTEASLKTLGVNLSSQQLAALVGL